MDFSGVTNMLYGGSGVTEAWYGGVKVWPTGSSETYTFVNRIYADLNANPSNLSLGHQFTLTSTVRLQATTRKYTGGLHIGTGNTRFFAYSRTAFYYDLGKDSGIYRLNGSSTKLGVSSGKTYDLYLTNHAVYNAAADTGQTGTTITDIQPTALPMAVKLSHLYVYLIEYWDNGVQLGNYRPAKRNSDGLYGLYDTINDIFYTTTDFTIYGDDGT